MISFLRWIFGILITAGALLFALANRAPVSLTWSPVDPPMQIPAFLLGLGGLAFGFFLGCLFSWLNSASDRREQNRQRKLLRRLEAQSAESVPKASALPSLTTGD